MPTKQHVTHVITGLTTGGAETMLLKLVQNSQSAFHHAVVSLGDGGTLGPIMQRAGVSTVSLNLKPGALQLNGVGRLVHAIRRTEPDVVQGWMYHGNLAATVAKSLAKKRAALSWSVRCSFDERDHDKWLTRTVVNVGAGLSFCPRAIIYNSIRSRREHAAYGYADRKALVIPNGFDVGRFLPSLSLRDRAREQWNVQPGQVVVGILARVHPMKDHATFLRAAADVLSRMPTAMFVVAGRGAPNLSAQMPELVQRLGANLLLLPEVADVAAFMNGLDVFALSSAWGEAFPNVLGEAMACGVPCVATDVGDCGEIVGDAGMITPAEAPTKLAAAIVEMISAPTDVRRQLGEKGRARILAKYTIEAVARQYEDVWRAVADRSKSGASARSAC